MLTCAALTLGLHLGTYHFDRETRFKEFNPGIYATCDEYTAGLYRNSLDRPSAYITRNIEIGEYTLSIGGVTGYPLAPIVPLVIPSKKIGPARISILLPFAGNAGGFHVSYEW